MRQVLEFQDALEKELWIKTQKRKAQELRRTPWWKTQIGKGVCTYCGQKFPPQSLTMDHRIPVSRGGGSTKSNCVPACKACNTNKKNLTLVEQKT